MESLKKTGRWAGILYITIAVMAGFTFQYVPSRLIVRGDATTTASNIITSEGLFRAGIAGDIVIVVIEIVLVALLYVLLRPVNKTLSLVSALFRLGMTVIQAFNILTDFAALQVLSGADHLRAFEVDELYALALTFIEVGTQGEIIWEAFFAIHLATLGYLVFESGYIPRVLGILVAIAGLGYLIDCFASTLLPAYTATFEMIVIAMAVIPEASLPVWLAIRGVKPVEPVTVGEAA